MQQEYMFMHSRYRLPRLCANFVISPYTDNRATPDFIPPRWLTRSLSTTRVVLYCARRHIYSDISVHF